MYRKHWFIVFLFAAGIIACSKHAADNNNSEVFAGFQKPANFPEPSYDFANNPVTQDGFELGRKLFYDPILSDNNVISCGFCHIQTSAFTHHGHNVSHGIYDQLGTRNAPAVMNLAWGKTFMWDGGIFNLDLQPIAPITSHVEMGDTVAHVVAKLQGSTTYPSLFKKAFGSDVITASNMLKALSQFMVMCISSNAKYDSVMRREATFTIDEQAGYTLFQEKCSSCHKEPLFTDGSFRNNGMAIGSINDQGRYLISLHDSDKYKFKVPSLRNVEYTAPYMHDGSLYSLFAVLEHYGYNIESTPNLDTAFKQTYPPSIPLTADDETKIIAFLKTLSDHNYLTDKRLAEP